MSLSAALHATVSVLRRRPADLLPFYLLGTAGPAVARVAVLAGLAGAAAYLAVTGRLAAAAQALDGVALEPPDPEARPDAFAEWVEAVAPALDPLFAPAAVGLLLLALAVALVLGLVVAAAVSAGQLAACVARLRGRRGLPAGVGGIRPHWRAFLATFLVEGAVWVVASAVALLAVGGAVAVSPVLAVLVAPVAVLGWLLTVFATRAVFAFVPVAIVVDGRGLAGAVRGSARFVRAAPVAAVGYYAVALGALVAFSTVGGLLAVARAPAAAAPLALLVLAPVLDLVKTGLYLDHRGALSPPPAPAVGVRAQLSAGLRRGLRAVGRFVVGTPGLHGLALAVAALGGAAGWVAAAPLVGSVETSIAARLVGHLPPSAAVNFLANNWTIAASTAVSGVALAVPTLASLWTNGLLLGAVARLEVAPLELLAFGLPHGVVEVPAFVVAGALGLDLGLASWRTWRGRRDRDALADALERAFWVLVGLAALLAVAGVVEAFVSPYYWRPFL